MNTKALRQKILDLAIHGKLVPQDPNDEPASVLLERIKAEKERLIKEGKIKRTKRSKAACDKPHYPFELPEGWCWCKLGDVCSSFSTGPFGSMVHKSDYVSTNGTPIINPANIVNGRILNGGIKKVSNNKVVELTKYRLSENDILLARRGDLKKCAIVTNSHVNSLCGTGTFFLHLIFISPHYFRNIYSSNLVQDILKKDCVGATMDNLNQSVLANIFIPIPPLGEQMRINKRLEYYFSLLNLVEDEGNNLQVTIKQAKSKILDLAIHGKLVPQDPSDEPANELLKRINPKAEITCDNPHYRNLPKGWSAAPMQMLCSLVDGEKQSGVERINLDVKFLRGEREAKALSAGKYVAANTLLILVDGENSGEVFRSPVEGYQGSTFKQLAINDNMYTDYVLQVINLQRKTLRENKVGSAIPHLNKKLFKAIDVPIPPYEEQQRIVNAINKAFTTLDVIAENL